jgi:hypothetical protein
VAVSLKEFPGFIEAIMRSAEFSGKYDTSKFHPTHVQYPKDLFPYCFEHQVGATTVNFYGIEHLKYFLEDPKVLKEKIQQLLEYLKITRPDIILVEGFEQMPAGIFQEGRVLRKEFLDYEVIEPFKGDLEKMVAKWGDKSVAAYYVRKILGDDALPIVCPEALRNDEYIAYLLKQGHAPEHIFAMRMLLASDLRELVANENLVDLEAKVKPRFDSFRKLVSKWSEFSGWQEVDYSLQHLRKICVEIFGEKLDAKSIMDGIEPAPDPNPLQKIGNDFNDYRNIVIMRNLYEILKAKKPCKRVLCLIGACHAIQMEAAVAVLAQSY